jgi:hypothetical protein
MHRTRLAVSALAIAALCAIPAQALARQSPRGVAWYVKRLANRTLSSTGTPRAQLIQVVECTPRAYPRYICRGTFGDGSQILWAKVTLTDRGELRVYGNSVV